MAMRLDMTRADFTSRFEALLAMKREVSEEVDTAVRDIIADVVSRGDAALIDYSRRFDRVDLATLGLLQRIPQQPHDAFAYFVGGLWLRNKGDWRGHEFSHVQHKVVRAVARTECRSPISCYSTPTR